MSKFINSSPVFCSWVSDDIITNDRIDAYYYDNKFIEFEKEVIELGCEVLELEDIFEKITDGDHEQREYVSSGISFYSVKNIEEFYINSENIEYIKQQDHQRLKRSQLEYQDMLITKTGRIGTVAIVPYNFGEGNISADVAILKGNRVNIDKHYLATYLNSKYGELAITRLNYGSTRPRLTLKDIPKVRIPNVEHDIQKHIGDKVRKAEELREEAKIKRGEAKELFEYSLKVDVNYEECESNKISWVENENITIENITGEYYKSLYIELEEKIKGLGIELKTIEEISNGVIIGNTKKISDNYSDEGIPYLTTKNVKPEGVDFSALLYIPDEIHNNELKKSKVYPNDILYNKSGNVGLSAVLGDKYKEYNVVSDIIVIRPKHELVDPSYLVMYLNSPLGKKASERMAGGAIFKHISIYDVNKINVPILPYEQQVIIGSKIREAENLIENSKQLIQEAKKDVEDLIEGNFDMSKLNKS